MDFSETHVSCIKINKIVHRKIYSVSAEPFIFAAVFKE
jgi:hypothetical protein